MTKAPQTTTPSPPVAERPPAVLLEELLVLVLRDSKLSMRDREALERAVHISRTLQKATQVPPVAPNQNGRPGK